MSTALTPIPIPPLVCVSHWTMRVNNVRLVFLFASKARGTGLSAASPSIRGYATVARLDARQDFDSKNVTFGLFESEL